MDEKAGCKTDKKMKPEKIIIILCILIVIGLILMAVIDNYPDRHDIRMKDHEAFISQYVADHTNDPLIKTAVELNINMSNMSASEKAELNDAIVRNSSVIRRSV